MFLGTAEPLFTIAPDLLSTQFRICNSAGAAQHGNGASFSLLALERVFREYFHVYVNQSSNYDWFQVSKEHV